LHGVGRACRGDRAEAGAAVPGRHSPLGRELRVVFTRDRLSNTATRWRPPRAVKYPAAVPHRGGVKHSIGVLTEPGLFLSACLCAFGLMMRERRGPVPRGTVG